MGKQPAAAAPAAATPPAPDWKALSDAVGLPGALQEDGTFKIALPRPQLGTSIDGQRLPAGVGLGYWVGFAPCECGRTMIMGRHLPAPERVAAGHRCLPQARHSHRRDPQPHARNESRADLLPLLGGRDAIEPVRAITLVWSPLRTK